MSGIYIPGMEMPIDCCDCPMSGDYRMCCSLMPGVPALYAEFTDAIKTNRRHKDCPLVPVPKHGRLIDADALMAHFEKIADIEWNKKAAPISWSYAFEDVMDDIENAPTIVPADPAEEGEG